mmetsp:Transcript_83/g.251  ORF Transcript_83/g.251 Transcript_83/m.251 type:complete len:247 (-) Transcript_83:564-1304(-)
MHEPSRRLSWRQGFLLPLGHFSQDLLGKGIVPKMFPHGFQQSVDLNDKLFLKLHVADRSVHEGFLDALKLMVRCAAHFESEALPGEQNMLEVIQARILECLFHQVHVLVLLGLRGVLSLLRRPWAERVHDLAPHVLLRVLHEDGAVGIRLRHLRLSCFEAEEHVVRQNDGLGFSCGSVTVVPSQHVHLALVNAQLTDVCFQEEDVGALHDGIEDLRGGKAVLLPAHDLTTLLDPGKSGTASYVQSL